MYLKETGLMVVSDNDQIINEKIILSVEGEKRALELSKIDELQNIDVVFSSSYVRAKSTAKYIAYNNSLDINIDESFNERRLGILSDLKK